MSKLIKKNFKKFFTSDSEVLRTVNGDFILIIFKNGRSSCSQYARTNGLYLLTMQDLIKENGLYLHTMDDSNKEEIKLINIFLRDPVERFVSGVYSYSVFSELEIDKKFLHAIESFKTVDKHFVPQIFYLIHLFKFYKGKVKIYPLSKLKQFISNHKKPHPDKKITQDQKDLISSIKFREYVKDDQKLIKKYMGKTVGLEKIVKEFKYVLSTS